MMAARQDLAALVNNIRTKYTYMLSGHEVYPREASAERRFPALWEGEGDNGHDQHVYAVAGLPPATGSL